MLLSERGVHYTVTNLDPMNRGLKLMGAHWSKGYTLSYKPRPDE